MGKKSRGIVEPLLSPMPKGDSEAVDGDVRGLIKWGDNQLDK